MQKTVGIAQLFTDVFQPNDLKAFLQNARTNQLLASDEIEVLENVMKDIMIALVIPEDRENEIPQEIVHAAMSLVAWKMGLTENGKRIAKGLDMFNLAFKAVQDAAWSVRAMEWVNQELTS